MKKTQTPVQPTNTTQTPKISQKPKKIIKSTKTKQQRGEFWRKVEIGVLALVVVSNSVIGFQLLTGTTASAKTVSSPSSGGSEQVTPVTVPKMVGGC